MLLAIDTATRLLSIALADDAAIIAEHSWYTHNQHSVALAAAVQRAIQQAGAIPADLTAIAVAQGPGSFTGIRIGMGVAKGLAQALQIPLVGVPTLDIIAAASPHVEDDLTAVIQAGRGRIIAGRYGWQHGHWVPAGSPWLTTWPDLLEHIEAATLINGEIDETGVSFIAASQQPLHMASLGLRLRRAGFLAHCARERLSRSTETNPAHVVPIYLKQPSGD
ncbi:MAG: tRNA (adenosine(37)-N6)-threonylcarbamoyltransferase complex dimerization subunit type 1 TsaB [Chloroflexi bacterium]|nr:tRNA (adenosine(37)-N6)-threonylcarbamoyltransferase complex dimerization subunit type 1 TsaB [Chloroflexota bacterium]